MKRKLLILPLCLLMLVGCNDNNSTNSNSTQTSLPSNSANSTNGLPSTFIQNPDTGTITFNETLEILEAAAAQEALYASNATVKDTKYQGDIVYVSEENYEIFTDYSSYSEGTITMTLDEEVEEDTFIRRSMVVNDKIEVNNVVNIYPMFAQITDYRNDTITNNSYTDSASKVYLIDTLDEAVKNNLDASAYLLTNQYPVQASAKVAYNTLLFMENNIVGNVYVSQLGKNTLSYTKSASGYTLSFQANFSYNGDWDDEDTIYNNISLTLNMNSDLNRLLAVTYTHTMDDVVNSDESDHYFTGLAMEASVAFNTRQAVKNNITNANDYFLAKTEDVALIASLNGNRVVLDGSEIPANASYIWAKAKNYTPTLATNLDLTNYGSSNSSVIEFESDGFLKVNGLGTTTLSFVYFEKGEDDVYRQKIINKEVTVVQPAPTSVNFSYNFDVEGDTLILGETYNWNTYVAPTQANQSITAISNNPQVIEVSVDENYDLVLVAKSVGEATITITSTENPSLTAQKTLKVMDGSQDLERIISSKTYVFDYYGFSKKQYTMHLTFDGNGHGTRVDEIFTEATPVSITDHFDYAIDGTKITFSNWQLDKTYEEYFGDIDTMFDYATILEDGKVIDTYTENTLSHKVFNAQ